MNRSDFLRIIRDSGQVDRQMIMEVRELLDLFPWFQSAHLLLLKGLHNTEDVKFDSQLRQSAIYLADREVLYYMLRKPAPEKSESAEQLLEKTTPLQEVPDNQQVVIETGKSSEDIIHDLENQSTVSAGAEHMGQDSPVANPVQEVIIESESETDESASITLTIDDGDIHMEETVIFMDPAFSLPEQGELLELDENEFDLTDTVRKAEKTDEPVQQVEVAKKKKQSELIDQFILANPRIEPSRERSGRPVEDISAPFVEEKSGFVSETLAKIYISQGYYSRAIDIYEKLSLKYPEKSSYFATQIEKIKTLIK